MKSCIVLPLILTLTISYGKGTDAVGNIQYVKYGDAFVIMSQNCCYMYIKSCVADLFIENMRYH